MVIVMCGLTQKNYGDKFPSKRLLYDANSVPTLTKETKNETFLFNQFMHFLKIGA
jgi:hypothetical protein